jgi:hypothetical protein
VSFAQFDGPMVSDLHFAFYERHPDAPTDDPISFLHYSVILPDGPALGIRLAYAGEPVTVELGKTGVVEIREFGPTGGQWASAAGRATIHAQSPEGTLRVDFADVVLQEGGSKTRTVDRGFVQGQVSRGCYALQTSGGVTQHAWDATWSSAFCAPFKPK